MATTKPKTKKKPGRKPKAKVATVPKRKPTSSEVLAGDTSVRRPHAKRLTKIDDLDIDDLLTIQIPDGPERKLPEFTSTNRFSENARAARELGQDFNVESAYVNVGVTVEWLSQTFHMTPDTVKKKMALCPVHNEIMGKKHYRLDVAAGYLVKAQVNVREYLRDLRKADIPEELRESLWDALLKEQAFLAKGGDLWHTSDIIEVFGQAMQEIKSAMTLLPDSIEAIVPEAAKHRVKVRAIADGLMGTIRRQLTVNAGKRRTGNSAVRALKERGLEIDG